MSKLQYLAETSGQSLSRFVYGELTAALVEYLPEGSEQAYYYDLAQRLKRAGQGYRELDQNDLRERLSEAVQHGATGKLPSSGEGLAADKGTLSGLPDEQLKPRANRRTRGQGRKPKDDSNHSVSTG
jgi:hypothetical protein